MATTSSPQKSPEDILDQAAKDEQSGIVHDARGALARNSRLLKEIAALESSLKRPCRQLVTTKH